MNEKKFTLEGLLDVKQSSYYWMRDSVETLFIETLGIKDIVNKYSSFIMPNTKELAFKIISEPETDKQRIIERQDLMKFLIESDSFDEINSLFKKSYLSNEKMDRLDMWRRAVDHETGYSRSSYFCFDNLNHAFELSKDVFSMLEKIASIGEGTHLDSMKEKISSIKQADWWKTLEQEFPYDTSRILEHNEYEDKNNEYEVLFHNLKKHSGVFLNELDYFLGYAKGFRNLKKEVESSGLKLTFPSFPDRKGYRICDIKGGVNYILFMGDNKDKKKVPNDFFADELRPVTIITGENTYGKTMAIKTRGVIQAFAQASLPVIAGSAELNIADKILANVGIREDSLRGLSTHQNIVGTTFEMTKAATVKSVLILDEPTMGTYDLKAELQGRHFIEAFAEKGYEAWIVTHHLNHTNLAEKYSEIINLTTEVINGRQTFKLIPGVFNPTEETVKLDFTKEGILNQCGENRWLRLLRLYNKGAFPEDRLDFYETEIKPRIDEKK